MTVFMTGHVNVVCVYVCMHVCVHTHMPSWQCKGKAPQMSLCVDISARAHDLIVLVSVSVRVVSESACDPVLKCQ